VIENADVIVMGCATAAFLVKNVYDALSDWWGGS
jgi:hypothetical protein